MDRILNKYLDSEFTDILEDDLRAHGVKVQLNEMVKGFKDNEAGDITTVVTTGGEYEAEMVILCVGFRPNTDPPASKSTAKGSAPFSLLTENSIRTLSPRPSRRSLERQPPPSPMRRSGKNSMNLVIPRSSTLCAGCSHLGSYAALKAALAAYPEDAVHIVNGDIGCYEQAGYGIFTKDLAVGDEDSRRYPADSPYDMLDTLYVMGSGISMAHGQSKLGYQNGKLVAVCGDSTFFHAVLPALANAVYNRSDITLLVLDNRWTCMTGHQPNPNTGLDAYGQDYPRMEILPIVKALGVEYACTADALSGRRSYPRPSQGLLNTRGLRWWCSRASASCSSSAGSRRPWPKPM